MCILEHGTRIAHTLLRLLSKHSGSYVFYTHHKGGFAMISARGKYPDLRCFLRGKFFLQAKNLWTLTRAPEPVM